MTENKLLVKKAFRKVNKLWLSAVNIMPFVLCKCSTISTSNCNDDYNITKNYNNKRIQQRRLFLICLTLATVLFFYYHLLLLLLLLFYSLIRFSVRVQVIIFIIAFVCSMNTKSNARVLSEGVLVLLLNSSPFQCA